MITKGTRRELFYRSTGYCESPNCDAWLDLGWEAHHCYFRSHYRMNDRDEAWNLAAICPSCHRDIHDGGNRELADYFRAEADRRKPPDQRSTTPIKRPKKSAFGRSYSAQVERYKKANGGLAPWQKRYRDAKKRKSSSRKKRSSR